ncbi:MAG TPA: hypothetical protein VGW10_15220 [Solirubrobacteraceae bacterium]|nr:hypothetical protein [Solirubrobacteraceae bacterium]
MWFQLDNAALDAAQAVCIALPAAGLPAALARLRGRGWALVAPLSIFVSVAIIALWSASADLLAWIALILVPPGCALALGWAARGARAALALLAVPIVVTAFAAPGDSTAAELARLALVVGSCVTVGRLLAGATPLPFLKAAILLMAVVDAAYIFGDLSTDQNREFARATAGDDLPQLHINVLGNSSLDYGDFFAAGVVGALLAAERVPQVAAAVACLAFALLWNQLFLVTGSLPATVPPAAVLLGVEVARRVRPRWSPSSQAHRAG